MAAGTFRIPSNHSALLASQGSNWREIGCNADGMLYTHPWSNFGVSQDLLANDSDKTFTVPANHLWIVHWILIHYIATANAGTRNLTLDVRDATPTVLGRVGQTYSYVATNNAFAAFVIPNGRISTSITGTSTHALHGPLILPAGYSLRVYDLAAIDAAADDMEVTIGRQEIDDS